MRHEMFVHVYILLKLVVKTEVTSIRALCCHLNWDVYTAICYVTSKTVKLAFIVWICWKNAHNLKDKTLFLIKINNILYKTGSFQWSSSHAVVKTMLYLFGTHAYWTCRPVSNIFDTITCTVTVTPLIHYMHYSKSRLHDLLYHGKNVKIKILYHFLCLSLW